MQGFVCFFGEPGRVPKDTAGCPVGDNTNGDEYRYRDGEQDK